MRIGFREEVVIYGKKEKKLVARIDTGASRCSIDVKLAKELGLDKPIIKKTTVKSAHGISKRDIIKVKILISGKKMNVQFTIADRKNLKYDILIGRNILRKGFIIDSSKKL